MRGLRPVPLTGNPIGVPISMDDLTTRFEAGEPESELKKPLQS